MVLEVLELRAVLDELVDLGLEARVVRREALGVGDGAGGALLGRVEPRAEPRAPSSSTGHGGTPRGGEGLGGRRVGGAGEHATRMFLAARKANGSKAARIL